MNHNTVHSCKWTPVISQTRYANQLHWCHTQKTIAMHIPFYSANAASQLPTTTMKGLIDLPQAANQPSALGMLWTNTNKAGAAEAFEGSRTYQSVTKPLVTYTSSFTKVSISCHSMHEPH